MLCPQDNVKITSPARSSQLRDTQQEVKIMFMLMLCPQDNINDNVNVTLLALSSEIHTTQCVLDIVNVTSPVHPQLRDTHC